MKRPDTLFIGQVFHDLPIVASTNTYALELLSKSSPPEGTVISTFQQSEGRGQIGSSWESEPGHNISLSVVLYPVFLRAGNQFLLSQAVSLAVRDFVESRLSTNVKIKWPNDIYVENRKIAGILIQNTLNNNSIRSSVVGIGINVNQTSFLDYPVQPTSFQLESRQTFDLYELISTLCSFLEQRYLLLKSGQIYTLQQDYLRYLYRFGYPALYERANGQTFEGTIAGVSETGKLLVMVQGQTENFDLKEIRFL